MLSHKPLAKQLEDSSDGYVDPAIAKLLVELTYILFSFIAFHL